MEDQWEQLPVFISAEVIYEMVEHLVKLFKIQLLI